MFTSRHLILDLVDMANSAALQGKSRLVSSKDAPPNFPSFKAGAPAARLESVDMAAPAARCVPETTQATGVEQESAFPVGGCPACAGQHRAHTSGKGRAAMDRDAPDTAEHEADVEPKGGNPEEQQEEDSDGDKPLVPAKPGPAPPEPQAGQQELPLALRRIHQKLRDPVELTKLHLKHYHMTPNQFRRRTSALKQPEEIHRLYQETSRRCDGCKEGAPAPSWSRVTGPKAVSFGDLIFVDHAKVRHNDKLYLVLLILIRWCYQPSHSKVG